MSNRAKDIVKEVQILYKKQLIKAEEYGYHSPILYESTGIIQKLIIEFETLTSKNWDKSAMSYLSSEVI